MNNHVKFIRKHVSQRNRRGTIFYLEKSVEERNGEFESRESRAKKNSTKSD